MVTVVAAVAAPSAGAYSSSEAKYEKAQTAGVLFAKRRVASVSKGLATAADAIGGLAGRVKAVEDRVKKTENILSSTEYGVARVFASNSTTPVLTVVSPDIPDVGQPAAANGSVPFPNTAAGTVLTLRGAIRSNESDGTGADNPAGQAGGVLYATCLGNGNGSGCGVPVAANPGTGGGVDPGTLVCAPTSTPDRVFATPLGDRTLKLVPINDKASVFDQDAPAPGTDLTGGSCTLPASGVYNITVTSAFADIPNGIGGDTG